MKRIFLKENRKFLFILILAIALVNVPLYYAVINNLSLTDLFIAFFISFPLLGLLLSLIISIIPFNKLSYKDRLTQTTYISIFILLALLLIGINILIIFHLLGWR